MIGLMVTASSYFVWFVSTKGEGTLLDSSSWDGKDEYAFGAITILLAGIIGMLYVATMVKTRKSQ